MQDFWTLKNTSIPNINILPNGSDYSVFKKGVSPTWEDPKNQNGGRWLAHFSKIERKTQLDSKWTKVVLWMLENRTHSNEICGAVVSLRKKGSKIAIWTSNASNATAILDIGMMFKSVLEVMDACTIFYLRHSECDNQTGKYSYSV